jgi:hypothetical protein
VIRRAALKKAGLPDYIGPRAIGARQLRQAAHLKTTGRSDLQSLKLATPPEGLYATNL